MGRFFFFLSFYVPLLRHLSEFCARIPCFIGIYEGVSKKYPDWPPGARTANVTAL